MSLIRPAKDAINDRRASRSHVYHRFPSNLGAHAIVLNFKDYSYDATRSGITSISPRSSIVLPLPSNLVDTYTVNANQGSLGMGGTLVNAALGGASNFDSNQAVDALYGAAAKAGKGLADLFRNDGDIGSMPADFAAYAKFMSRSVVDGLSPGASMAIDLATGTAINPHVSVNFDGVSLKSHHFNWTFSPKDEAESAKLAEIQNAIRRAILPKYRGMGAVSGGFAPLERALLTYPNLVDIFFVGIEQSYYYYFKPAMVQQFEMNFTGGAGAPAILKGGKPALVTMSMQLMETQIHVSEDYGGSSGGSDRLTPISFMDRGA